MRRSVRAPREARHATGSRDAISNLGPLFVRLRGLRRWLLSATLLAAWVAILTWRMPVFRRCILAAFGGLWIAGIGLSVWLILLSIAGNRSAAWQRSVQALALGLSFVVGGLLLRALLRSRASPLVGRLLSLLSPLAVLLLILFVPPGQ
jgi:hypothetical protein